MPSGERGDRYEVGAREGNRVKRTTVECPYSPSCFTCPMVDCVANFPTINITVLNVLPGDLERAQEERHKTARKGQAVTV